MRGKLECLPLLLQKLPSHHGSSLGSQIMREQKGQIILGEIMLIMIIKNDYHYSPHPLPPPLPTTPGAGGTGLGPIRALPSPPHIIRLEGWR